MVVNMLSSPESPIPNVHDVQTSFHNMIQCGNGLHVARLTAAQEQLNGVVREHRQVLLYMETHGRPNSEMVEATEQEPWCLVSFHAVYDSACKSIKDSIEGLSRAQLQAACERGVNQITCLLMCVEVLVEALGWVLQPAEPTQHTANIMSAFQQRFGEVSAQATHTGEAGEGEKSVSEWLRKAQNALLDLSRFVINTYPYGPWFGHRNRRAAVRSRRLRHPSDIDEAPFKALILASHSVKDDDITLLSEVLLRVAQAHTVCLRTVRCTEIPPTDSAALAEVFTPLNDAINDLSSACEDVISRREDDRPHAHAVLEAGNIFTWLTSKQEPCVVVEEAFGSANLYLNKITARGNVLLLQQETGFTVERCGLTKAMVTWASMLREVLQRMMLMVVYRYPRYVPWGEMVEKRMPRNGNRDGPQAPQPHHHQQLVWQRGAAESASRAPMVPAAQEAGETPQQRSHPTPSQTSSLSPSPRRPPPSSLPPPPPSLPSSSTAPTTAAAAAVVATAMASPDTLSPSCVFDAATNTWTLQNYHQPLLSADLGEELEPLYVVIPEEEIQQSNFVRILHCFNVYVTVPKKVKGVTVEHCEHTKLQLVGAIGPIRISDTKHQEMLIETSAPRVFARRVSGLILHLAGSHETEIITELTTNVNVNVMVKMADGEQEARELAVPAQFISTIGEGDVLRTTEVTYSS